MEETAVRRLEQELRRKITGEVKFDRMSRLLFSTDASLYKIDPLGVTFPRSRQEAVQVVRTAAKHGAPILPRGGGTALAGQTVLQGVVVDCSKYLNNILEFNADQRWIRVQPGIILDNLNAFLKPHGLHFAPDVATSSRANVGGMMGNNSAGVRSIRYGKTVDHVLELSIILSTGEELELRPLSDAELEQKSALETREGQLYREIRGILQANREEIRARFPKVMRRVGGYNLDLMVDEKPFNLCRLLVGSEGTLACVTEAKLNLEPIPRYNTVSVLHFDDLIRAVESVPRILEFNPSAVEILDHYGLELARAHPSIAPLCARFITGEPRAILWVEFSGDSEEEVLSGWRRMKEALDARAGVYTCYDATDEAAKEVVWGVRKNSLGILLGMKGDAKPLPFVEDACVPVENLAEYVSRTLDFCRKQDRAVAMYAHASAGVIHIRPILNLKEQKDLDILRAISQKVFEMVVEYGGSWSGEHGDGLVRSYKNREFFGERIYEAFRQVKRAFDPLGLMNPGKIVDAQDIGENLRISPRYRTSFPPPHYRYRAEQGFDRSIEMCTGVGHCRKTLAGTMCPSYMATREEEHSTRGRATALRMAISGELGADGLNSRRLFEVMDLCLECKACKAECPSGVDMARLKTEFLAHYYASRGLPLRKQLVARLRQGAEWASSFPRLSNRFLRSGLSRRLLELLLGIDRRRTLPLVAERTFTQWFQEEEPRFTCPPEAPRVALFVDTFTNFYEPRVGEAAVRLLHRLGWRVVLADSGCCGRPLISTGQLTQAKERGADVIRRLSRHTDAGTPVIVLEPSCLSTFRDDFPDLMEDEQACRAAVRQVLSLEEFLGREEVLSRLSAQMGPGPQEVLFHGHCQQKALLGTLPSLAALGTLKGTRTREPDSGCCGMAGPFGYEKEHYSISRQIGELRLFPVVRETPEETRIVASGFSCRSQIRHFTGRSAKHLAEVLAEHLSREDPPGGPANGGPK